MKRNGNVHFSSLSNEWATPTELFSVLNREFGFTLDPCATKETAKCRKFYTKEQDGLAKTWASETVFMNPPYGREIGDWVKKAYNESKLGGAVVVCLIPARTDTSYWHDYVMRASEIRLIRGRIKFILNGSMKAQCAPFPSAIVIFANEEKQSSGLKLTTFTI